jgi:hypothetical protein
MLVEPVLTADIEKDCQACTQRLVSCSSDESWLLSSTTAASASAQCRPGSVERMVPAPPCVVSRKPTYIYLVLGHQTF